MNVDEVTTATRAVVRVQGCTCDLDGGRGGQVSTPSPAKVEDKTRELEVVEEAEGMFHVTAHHDDWCPLLRSKRRGWN